MLITDIYPLTSTPRFRGELLNNPTNMRPGNPPIPWLGLSPVQTDSGFAQFISPDYGYRAAAITMRTHATNTRNIPFTLAKAITIWAPPEENDTDKYIANVSQWTGIITTDVIDVLNMSTMLSLLAAITREEQGRCIYPTALIQHGLTMVAGWHDAPADMAV